MLGYRMKQDELGTGRIGRASARRNWMSDSPRVSFRRPRRRRRRSFSTFPNVFVVSMDKVSCSGISSSCVRCKEAFLRDGIEKREQVTYKGCCLSSSPSLPLSLSLSLSFSLCFFLPVSTLYTILKATHSTTRVQSCDETKRRE